MDDQVVEFSAIEQLVEKIVEIEGIADFFSGYGDGGKGQMVGNIADPAGGNGGSDQEVGDGTDSFVFVDKVKKVSIGTAAELLLELSMKFWRPPDGYGDRSFGHRKHLAVFWKELTVL